MLNNPIAETVRHLHDKRLVKCTVVGAFVKYTGRGNAAV